MPFIAPERITKHELFPGIDVGLVAGERMMLSFLELAEGSAVPPHKHPEEQGGFVLSGRLRLRIGDTERILSPGEAYIAPPNVVHAAYPEGGPARVLDVFSPPRKDYLAKVTTTGITG